MKDWKDLDLQDSRWVQTGMNKREYELRGGDGEVLATMRRPSWWNQVAEVDAPGNRWRFELKGVFRQRIVIRSLGSGHEPAQFAMSMNGGTLTFADGRIFHWRQANLWGTKWAWMSPDGQPLLGFQSGGLLKLNAEMHLAPAALDMPSLALLVFLGWYLIVNYYEASVVMVAGI